jgi:hypothetical protein
MQQYTPAAFLNVPERSLAEACIVRGASLVRGLQVTDRRSADPNLLIQVGETGIALSIPLTFQMTFGTETVSAADYFRRVMERGDLIDAVVHGPANSRTLPTSGYWIQIRFVGNAADGPGFSKKDDGLFALRAKAGEKAERIAARSLAAAGHTFFGRFAVLQSPGFFEIRYAGKKYREVDRSCSACGLQFEVKKRNRDSHIRVSHSTSRTFWSENDDAGWHAFVMSDMSVRYVSNADIGAALRRGNFTSGSDAYDRWADVHLAPDQIRSTPPACKRHEP